MGRAVAVDLDPDFDARVLGRLAAGDQRLADLLQRLGDLDLLGRPLGRTLTPLPPMSATSSTNCLHVSMFFWTTAGSGLWNSQTVPQPQMSTPASAKRFFTSLRCSLLSDGSTPCLWVVRSSTGETPAA